MRQRLTKPLELPLAPTTGAMLLCPNTTYDRAHAIFAPRTECPPCAALRMPSDFSPGLGPWMQQPGVSRTPTPGFANGVAAHACSASQPRR